ncbi:MAG TPA: hypothetical protein VHT53_11735 [Candidatus Elarobacter sp.]|jgi:hypothetical protein|nr:hypothetical protein [Candidatus Elarobacter sp.]
MVPFAAACAAFVLLPCAARADRPAGVTAAVPAGDTVRLSAAHPIPTEIASQPGPVHIDGCFSDGRGADGLTVVHHAVRISNGGDRPITAVRLRFAFYDAFGDVNETRTNVAQVKLDPGTSVDRVNLAELSDAGPPSRVSCSVDAVRYADGTVARSGPAARG